MKIGRRLFSASLCQLHASWFVSWGQIMTTSPLVCLAWFIQLSANVQACVSVGVSYWTGAFALIYCGHDLQGTTSPFLKSILSQALA